MRIQPQEIPVEDKPRGRGRPAGAKNKIEPAAQPEQPGQAYLPPGSPMGSPTAIEVNDEPSLASDWLMTRIEDAVGQFKNELADIIRAASDDIVERAAIQNEPQPVRFTCADCMFVDLDSQPTCTKYQASPPLAVVFDAEKMCLAFMRLP